MPRVPFRTVFRRNDDGSIQPTQQVRISGITLSPELVLRAGQIIAGIDFTQYEDRDFEIDIDGIFLVIKGIYPKP